MKRIIYILCLCLFASCDSWLDVKPENGVTYTNFFEDETDLEAIVTNINAYFAAYVNESQVQIKLGTLADEWSDTYEGNRKWDPRSVMRSGFGSPWKCYYDVIFQANVLLENSGRAAAAVSEERMNFYNGQAHFAKALSYFMLSRHFGEAVITDNSIKLDAYGKSTVIEVIDEAIRNAVTALSLLPQYDGMKNAAGNTITSKQYGNQGSTAAMLAHMYAWKGSLIDLFGYQGDAAACYATAIRYADTLIDGKVGAYTLQPSPEDLCTAISNMGGNNPESILEIELNPDAWDFPTSWIPAKEFIGWPVNKNAEISEIKNKDFRIYRTTVNQIYEAGDKRRPAYFYEEVIFNDDHSVAINPPDSLYAYVYKWREGLYKADNSQATVEEFITLKANQTIWRLGDIYLLRAECHAKLKHDNLAAADLNKIRERAGATLYPAAQDTEGLQFAVFKEREKELFGEGHRFFDIVRNGMSYIHRFLGETFMQLSDQDIRDGAIFLNVPDEAFTSNDLMRQNIYWKQYEN